MAGRAGHTGSVLLRITKSPDENERADLPGHRPRLRICGDRAGRACRRATWRRPCNEGVRQGYTDGYLRKSVVRDPHRPREHRRQYARNDLLRHRARRQACASPSAPKGAGSENMSQIKMLKPSDGVEGVKEFVLKRRGGRGPEPLPADRGGRRRGRHLRQGVRSWRRRRWCAISDVRNADPFWCGSGARAAGKDQRARALARRVSAARPRRWR